MPPENETFGLEAIAKAFRTISREISYQSLARALLDSALEHSGAARGAVVMSEGGMLLVKADASFPRERQKVVAVHPPLSEFRLSPDLLESVLMRQEAVVRHHSARGSALVDPGERQLKRAIAFLCSPLVLHEQTIGILYLESDSPEESFSPSCVAIMSLLVSQAAVSFESAQLFQALRETNMWMVKGQQLGRMGSYRWNTRTLLSRASRECYRIFDIDLDVNPVPFEVFRSRIHRDDLAALEQALTEAVSAKSAFSHEYRVVHEDGEILHVIAAGEFDVGPTGDLELEGIITDITERKASEQALTDARAELGRASRLASLGELAGSIVHEINQPLTGIIASAEACLRWLARGPDELDGARRSVMRIVEQGRRASNVVSGLRSLVRDGQAPFVGVQIPEVVEEVLLLSKRELERADVTLKTDFADSRMEIEGDRTQLQQVVLNLVSNAIDAMADLDGRARVLTISSKVVDGHARVTVADTGAGVDPAITMRLFEALCTTKAAGLGLGLSICRRIVNSHGGRLWLENSTTQGAAFTFAITLRTPIS